MQQPHQVNKAKTMMALQQSVMCPILVEADLAPLMSMTSLIQAQARASPEERSVWLKRGAVKNTLDGPQQGLWRSSQGHFVLPVALLRCAIRNAHGRDHCARGEVIRHLQAVWWSPFLAATVERVLHECDVCAKYNTRKAFSAPIAHIPPPDGPFRHLMIDYIDMTQRIGKLRYVLVVVCRFSWWIEASPTSSPDASSVAKFLCREVFPRFGIPDTLSSDKGPHFVAATFQATLKMLGIKQKFGCVYHPQSQGQVERANKTLKEKLAKILADIVGGSKLNWEQALPLALMSMRMSTNRLTHLTPHEMLTGRPMLVPYLRGPYEGPALEQLEGELQSYLQHLTHIYKEIFSQVKGATEERDAEIPGEKQTIQSGDLVYIHVFKRKKFGTQARRAIQGCLSYPTALKVEEYMADGHQSSWEPRVGPTPPCVPVSLTGDPQQPSLPHQLLTLFPVSSESYPPATPGPGLGLYPPLPTPATSRTNAQWNLARFMPRSYAPYQSLSWQNQLSERPGMEVPVPPPLSSFRSNEVYEHQSWFNPLAPQPHAITAEQPGPARLNMGDRREPKDNLDTESLASLASPISFCSSPDQSAPPNSPSPVMKNSSSPHISSTIPNPMDEPQPSYKNDVPYVTQNRATLSYNEFRFWVPNAPEQEAALATSMTLVSSQSHYQRECCIDQEVREEIAHLRKQNEELNQQIAELNQQNAEFDQQLIELNQRHAMLSERLSIYQRLRGSSIGRFNTVYAD
ncbi:uncharacterized protein LOC115370641 [Myripristis murdjan]|uniref:uncharacterized protein LOC115370641 n=1 Tax=Myripristis murdjan TaxID=586833 RepID=UPI001175E37A|nr:uncharacterized protein LOC115370641 [Myripristis murdjan]